MDPNSDGFDYHQITQQTKNPFIYAAYGRIKRHQWMSLEPISLPNTETGKNLAQQIIAGELAGDARQAVMRQA